jgi:hypothetical protein
MTMDHFIRNHVLAATESEPNAPTSSKEDVGLEGIEPT